MRKAHPHGLLFANVRHAQGLSLRAMARHLNITYSHLFRVESGERLPSTNMYFALMMYLEKPIDQIRLSYGQLQSNR